MVSKVSVETDYRVLQKIDVILYSVYILRQSFTRPFEVKQLPSSWSCSSKGGNHLFLITNDEKGLSFKKSFWKVYHDSKCFCRYYTIFFQLLPIFEKLNSRFKSFFIKELKNTLNNTLVRYMHLFILNYPLQYAKELVI